MTASFCNVALAVPLRTVFTYGVPESLRELVQAGTRVLVPFRVAIPTPLGMGVLEATQFVTVAQPAHAASSAKF